jgi:hypothetical protein
VSHRHQVQAVLMLTVGAVALVADAPPWWWAVYVIWSAFLPHFSQR